MTERTADALDVGGFELTVRRSPPGLEGPAVPPGVDGPGAQLPEDELGARRVQTGAGRSFSAAEVSGLEEVVALVFGAADDAHRDGADQVPRIRSSRSRRR